MRLLSRSRHSATSGVVSHGIGRGTNRNRFLIFLVVAVITCAGGLVYTFARPALYETSSSLLITPPETEPNAETTAVGFEIHSLTANSLLTALLTQFEGRHPAAEGFPQTLADLRGMLGVRRVAGTNIVELRARGPEPEILPAVVNAWTESYVRSQTETQRASMRDQAASLERQAEELAMRTAAKREEVAAFRRQHDIVTMQGDENRLLARLAALNRSLEAARNRELKARTSLDTIRHSLREGKPVMRQQDLRTMANLEQRATALREEIKELEQRFTPRYMALDPQVRALFRRLELVEAQISTLRREGRDTAVALAESELANAQNEVREITAELDQNKQRVGEFTTRFAEHQALTEELAQLERNYREVRDRQVRQQVDRQRELTRIRVLETALTPGRPIWPDYDRDTLISVAAAIVLGFVAVLFYDFFTRQPRPPAMPQDVRVVHSLSPAQTSQADALAAPDASPAIAPPLPALAVPMPRELSEAEARKLVVAADDQAAPLIGSLLSGLSIGDAAALRWIDIDLDAGRITRDDPDAAAVTLAPPLASAFGRFHAADTDRTAAVWRDEDGDALTPDALESLIARAAHDAALNDPDGVTAESLRHTYIGFLLRQGAQLSDVERLVGGLPPSQRSIYKSHVAPAPGVPGERLVAHHPAIAELARS